MYNIILIFTVHKLIEKILVLNWIDSMMTPTNHIHIVREELVNDSILLPQKEQ